MATEIENTLARLVERQLKIIFKLSAENVELRAALTRVKAKYAQNSEAGNALGWELKGIAVYIAEPIQYSRG